MQQIKIVCFFLIALIACPLFALEQMLKKNQDLIGSIKIYQTDADDNKLETIALKHDVGFNVIQSANPHLASQNKLPKDALVKIPSSFLLPDLEREGIVINLPEMRMYYFLEPGRLLTFPIGIGKVGKNIPITNTYVTKKVTNPEWIPPADIREWNLKQGITLPRVMPPGPENPLGPYAIYMKLPTYLIHSTIFPESIGKRASFGCVRMYEKDVKILFARIKKGTPISIINEPIKIGQNKHFIYLEHHESLSEYETGSKNELPLIAHKLVTLKKHRKVIFDWQKISFLAQLKDGVPHEIGMKI